MDPHPYQHIYEAWMHGATIEYLNAYNPSDGWKIADPPDRKIYAYPKQCNWGENYICRLVGDRDLGI